MAYNIGSVVAEVGLRLDNIPSAISGTAMNNIVVEELNFAEQETGITIGSTAIAEKYCGPLIKLVMSNVQSIIEVQGSDKQSISLGELSIGKSSNVKGGLADKWREEAVEDLKNLKGKYNYYQTFS